MQAFERLTQPSTEASSSHQQSLPQPSRVSENQSFDIGVDANLAIEKDETQSLPSSANHPSDIVADADSRKENEPTTPSDIAEIILDEIIEAAVMMSSQQKQYE